MAWQEKVHVRLGVVFWISSDFRNPQIQLCLLYKMIIQPHELFSIRIHTLHKSLLQALSATAIQLVWGSTVEPSYTTFILFLEYFKLLLFVYLFEPRKLFHWLFCSPRLKSGDKNSIQFCHIDGWDSSTWISVLRLISRKLDWRYWSCCYTTMPASGIVLIRKMLVQSLKFHNLKGWVL